VLRFLAGFLTASLLWGGFIYAYSRGFINVDLGPKAGNSTRDAGVEPESATDDGSTGARKRRGSHAHRGYRKDKDRRYAGESTSGDDLGGPETRNLEAANAGGEEQLLGHEIEQGFDSVFPQVKRCLMLAAGDEPMSGKIVFGLRIAGHGGITRVSLQGPSAITQGEAGDCLRKAARGIRFRSFNGPDMLVHYPLTLQ
jgi:hypothetical protein